MAAGDLTLTHHGSHKVSGGSLISTVNALNITYAQKLSGAELFLIPTNNGNTIDVFKLVIA